MPWWRRRLVMGALVGFSVAAFLGIMVFAAFFRAYRIPSGAMRPNLLVGDFFYARKLAADASIARGDIIVFEYPGDRRMDFVMRCVALSGDTVEIRDGVTYVNGAVFESALDDPGADHSCVPRDRGAGCPEPHTRLDPRGLDKGQFNRQFGPLLVPAGHLFVMGDNRYNALDSRYWGPLPRAFVKSRAAYIYWSWGPDGLRGGRLLERVR